MTTRPWCTSPPMQVARGVSLRASSSLTASSSPLTTPRATMGAGSTLSVKARCEGSREKDPARDWKFDRKRSEGGMLGQLTVDAGSAAFKDRLYVVYPAIVSDRIQIQLSYSADQGKTWAKPVTVNDDRSPEEGGKGPDHLLPSIG